MSNNESSASSVPILSGWAYKTLKPVATTILPGLGTLYISLSLIWGLPAAEQVVGTTTAINVFLGLLLGLSTRAYNRSDEKYDGQIDVNEKQGGGKKFTISVKDEDPETIAEKDQVLLRVNKTSNLAR